MSELADVARLPWQVRKYRRFSLSYPVHLLLRCGADTSEVEAVSRNVCIGGLLLDCPIRLSEQCAVNFVINVQTPTLRSVNLVGEGKVVRVEETQAPGQFAIALECGKPITEIEAYFPRDSN